MKTHSGKFKARLGLFVLAGTALFFLALFIIGKQRNLFNPVFQLSTTFKNVSGLQVGNNIRFAGINVGTVEDIKIVNDSTVQVDMMIRTAVREFIKSDCSVALGSEGLIGDRLLIISQGSPGAPLAREGQNLASSEPVERDEIMNSLQETVFNAEVITEELAEIMVKVNSGQGTLGKLLQDSTISKNLDATIINLRESAKGLNENMDAAKDNIFLRGYYRRKAREAEKKRVDDSIKNANENTKEKLK